MSHQDHINALTDALNNYKGLTRLEKAYGLDYIEENIDENGVIRYFIEKFEEIEIDITPFLEEYKKSQI